MTQTIDLAEIRLASEAEARACRMLLPAAFGPQDAPDRLLVAVGSDGVVLGAAAAAWRVTHDAPGFPVLVTVVPPMRRHDLGRRLLKGLAADAAGEATALRSWTPLPPDSEAAAFLRGCGFVEAFRFVTFEASNHGVATFNTAMHRSIARLLARGRIPADVQVVSGNSAPAPDIALLAAREFPGITPHAVAQMESGDFGVFDPASSVVVVHRDRVVAASLCREADDMLQVDMTMVCPDYRNGWANILMLQAVADRCVVGGMKGCRFSCDSRVRDTMKLAPRTGAQIVAEVAVFVRRLPAA